MQMKGIFFFTTLILLLFSAFSVYAIGSSDGGVASGARSAVNSARANLNPELVEFRARLMDEYRERLQAMNQTCDDINQSNDRIKCRLVYGKNYTARDNTIPEGCLRAKSPLACKRLYRDSEGCFELQGKEKNLCFRRVSGFVKEKIKDEVQDGKNKTRNYVVLMLYDLQERVEKAYEDGKIDVDESTALIAKIAEIKQAILDGKTKAEIRTMMQELKQMWRDSII